MGIVSWNTAGHLERCLRALPAAMGGLDAEIVVVDNASGDGSAEVAERAGVRVIRNARNVGYAVAMNAALGGTDAPVLIALNPDTEPPPRTLERLVADLDERADAGVVVPRLVGPDGAPQTSARTWPTPGMSVVAALVTRRRGAGPLGRRFLLDGSAPHPTGPVPWAIGAVHVIRAAALAGEGPYVERSFMYAEDLELCWRLSQRGWSTWLDGEVVIPHVGGAAAAPAWGPDRTLRYWTATYDVVALRRDKRAARRLAAAGVAATAIAAGRSLPAALVGGSARRGRARDEIRQRAREARLHAQVAISGPRPPDVTPPGAP